MPVYGYSPFAAQEPFGAALQNIAAAMFQRGGGRNAEVDDANIALHKAQAEAVASKNAREQQIFAERNKTALNSTIAYLVAQGVDPKEAPSMAYQTRFGNDIVDGVQMPEQFVPAGGYNGRETWKPEQVLQDNKTRAARAAISSLNLNPATELSPTGGGGNPKSIADAFESYNQGNFQEAANLGYLPADIIQRDMTQRGKSYTTNLGDGVTHNSVTNAIVGNDETNPQIKDKMNRGRAEVAYKNSQAAKNYSGIRVDEANIGAIGALKNQRESATKLNNANTDKVASSAKVKESGVVYPVKNPLDVDALVKSALNMGDGQDLLPEVHTRLRNRIVEKAKAAGLKGGVTDEIIQQSIMEENEQAPYAFEYKTTFGGGNRIKESGLANVMTGKKSAPPPAPTAPAPTAKPKKVERPKGMSDAQIIQEANAAISAGKDPDVVRQRLLDMGVKF